MSHPDPQNTAVMGRSPIQIARAKKQAEIITNLTQRFTAFPYPVYLFGSFATGLFHGYSDVDLVILAPKDQYKTSYSLAYDQLSGMAMPYDILVCSSLNELDESIRSSLQVLHTPRHQTMSESQRGISLIELMIALLIGAFFLGGVLQIFANTKQTYRMQEALSRLQENGRHAMEFISRDVRMAGYFGCLSGSFNPANIENALNDQANFAWNLSNPVIGHDNVANTFALVNAVVPGTDVIATYRMSDNPIPLISPFNNSAQMFVHADFNADCPATQATTCHEGEILMVTDCRQGTIFQTTNTTNVGGGSGVNVVHSANNTFTPGNDTPPVFDRNYGPGSEIARISTFVYYIRLNPAGEPSLYRSRLATSSNRTNALSAEELVEGIENLQIIYGVDTGTDGAPDYFVPASGVTAANWANVVAVRVSLLVRTPANNIAPSPVAYTYNGATPTPADRRLRRVFTSTIALRNRLD
ncbi:MAG: PilW family protein [Methylomonas sp.]|nr:PilW family protein [Methylomonas sp.]